MSLFHQQPHLAKCSCAPWLRLLLRKSHEAFPCSSRISLPSGLHTAAICCRVTTSILVHSNTAIVAILQYYFWTYMMSPSNACLMHGLHTARVCRMLSMWIGPDAEASYTTCCEHWSQSCRGAHQEVLSQHCMQIRFLMQYCMHLLTSVMQ